MCPLNTGVAYAPNRQSIFGLVEKVLRYHVTHSHAVKLVAKRGEDLMKKIVFRQEILGCTCI